MLYHTLLKGIFGRSLVWGLCVAILALPLPGNVNVAQAASLKQQATTIERYAKEYGQAMSILRRVAGMNLSREKELRRALTLLKQADGGLRYWSYYAGHSIGTNRTTQQIIKRELSAYLSKQPSIQTKAKRAKVGPDKRRHVDASKEVQTWLAQLQAKPSQIRSWSGMSGVEKQLSGMVQKDAAVIKNVALKLKTAAKRKAGVSLPGVEAAWASLENVLLELTADGDPLGWLATPAYALDPVTIGLIIGGIAVAVGVAGIVIGAVCLTLSLRADSPDDPLCGDILINEIDVDVPPRQTYDECVAECQELRSRCLELAASPAGREGDADMCWYRYYDDCLWSDCEKLRE